MGHCVPRFSPPPKGHLPPALFEKENPVEMTPEKNLTFHFLLILGYYKEALQRDQLLMRGEGLAQC